MILAGDVGGTKTRLALYQIEEGELVLKNSETFASADYLSLGKLARDFLTKHQVVIDKACLGVPGPVIDGEAQATNLPWKLQEAEIAQTLGIPTLKLVNDLVATTASLPHLAEEKLAILHQGRRLNWQEAFCAVLAPGTGLGQAFLQCQRRHYQVLASEGGHADFAPTNDLEVELLRYLKSKFGRVSYERVVSGPGLVNIYSFLRDTHHASEPPELHRRLQEEDPAAVISATGLAGEFEICVQALDIFASVLGAQAGNLVLTLLATGGVFLGGGIPPKIIEKLKEGGTAAAYRNKGRLSSLVEKTTLRVIKDDFAAILGAAHLAMEL